MRRFTDRLPGDFPRPDVNPYVASHREFGEEVLPATEAATWRGRWAERFGRDAPLHVEIGSGNGFYLSGMAALHPEADWIGVEVRYKRVVLAARKLRAAELGNALVCRFDGLQLDQLFLPGSLAGIHVNHPDPWARHKHAKHRLVGRTLAEMAARLLAPGGELRLKTDFSPHVEALVEALDGLPFEVAAVRRDLAGNGAPWPDDVVTNYERKARVAGRPVDAAWLRRV